MKKHATGAERLVQVAQTLNARRRLMPGKAVIVAELEAEDATAIAPRPALFQEREAETIVRQNARPVMVIRENRVTTEFIGPNSDVWAGRTGGARGAQGCHSF